MKRPRAAWALCALALAACTAAWAAELAPVAASVSSAAVSFAPRAALLRAAAPKTGTVEARVLAVSSAAVYVLPPFPEVPGDTYATQWGPALSLRRLAWPFPFSALDDAALYRAAPWISQARRFSEKLYSVEVILRVLLNRLDRPVLETSGANLPQGAAIPAVLSNNALLWSLAQREGSRSRIELVRAYPQLLAPAWAYLCAARDDIRRVQKLAPKPTALGNEIIFQIDTLEGALGRLLKPGMPIGNDREQIGRVLLRIADFAAGPSSVTMPAQEP